MEAKTLDNAVEELKRDHENRARTEDHTEKDRREFDPHQIGTELARRSARAFRAALSSGS